jgi:hypothetical protein
VEIAIDFCDFGFVSEGCRVSCQLC